MTHVCGHSFGFGLHMDNRVIQKLLCYSAPCRAENPYCDDLSVCLSVCLVASISPELHVRSSPILRTLHMSVARSSSGGVAIRYVLPVLWMTSCLYIMARNRRRNSDSITSSMDLSPWTVAYTQTGPPGNSTGPGVESDIYDCLVAVCFVLLAVGETSAHVFSANDDGHKPTLLVINFYQIAK